MGRQKLVEFSYRLKIGNSQLPKEKPVYSAQVLELPGIFLQGSVDGIRKGAPGVTFRYLDAFPQMLKQIKMGKNKAKDLGVGITLGEFKFKIDLSPIGAKRE
ncbi:MAG: hypothetical protein KGH61_05255 [Candidatus Micrarchaeota archaeon]|nr:hypothetical protein [Candidatus Micrarchaeota archaeon]MDE1848322.1 hypothetical protein [Candidatus Micrarchaeota archaeon]MDE1864911.1 hypothetical protein [Candidatus Micrarchaeota archaeon]